MALMTPSTVRVNVLDCMESETYAEQGKADERGDAFMSN